MDIGNTPTERIQAVRADGGDTCARVSALLKFTFCQIGYSNAMGGFTIKQITPVSGGMVCVMTWEGKSFIVPWYTDFGPFHLARTEQEFLHGSGNTNVLFRP